MKMPPLYRPDTSPAGTARRDPSSDVMDSEGGFGAEKYFNREIHAPVRRLPGACPA
ncbi:unnamed protein product [marine sediment metagenome]|uniref:Uncharacterized protein n=1 Tax=marine sediment metagenome TaxID=412755 RepID=X1TVR4_9ZZZZ